MEKSQESKQAARVKERAKGATQVAADPHSRVAFAAGDHQNSSSSSSSSKTAARQADE